MELGALPIPPPRPSPEALKRIEDLRYASEQLEAQFLAMMLESSGLGEVSKMTGGGAGEEQFASIMRMEYAKAMAASGGVGIAEMLFDSLSKSVGSDR